MPTPQAPIGSPFGAAATAAEVIKGIDLTGKTVIVTGGYSGIGVETVRAFRSAGAKVVAPTRDMGKAEANLSDMPDVALAPMDLLDPGSIGGFAEWFLGAYGQSKTANSLFAVALDSIGQRLRVRAFAVHPGAIVTGLIRHMSKAEIDASKVFDESGEPVIDPQNSRKTPQQGAATSVWCATSRELEGRGASIAPTARSPVCCLPTIRPNCTGYVRSRSIPSPPADSGA